MFTNDRTLEDLFRKFGTDKLGHGYAPFYCRYINPEVTTSLLEVGINTGASLRAWREWLPATSTVTGIDINDAEPIDGVTIIKGDATYPAAIDPLPNFDVIIDDASHNRSDIAMTLLLLWPKLNHNGWYVIEDLLAPQATYAAVIPLLERATSVHIHGEIAFGFKS